TLFPYTTLFRSVHGEDVSVRAIARGRARAFVSQGTAVGAGVEGVPGQGAVVGTGALRKRGDRDVQIGHRPVPIARGGGGVRVEAGDDEAFGLRGEIRPGKFGRNVLSACAVAGREFPAVGECARGNGQ